MWSTAKEGHFHERIRVGGDFAAQHSHLTPSPHSRVQSSVLLICAGGKNKKKTRERGRVVGEMKDKVKKYPGFRWDSATTTTTYSVEIIPEKKNAPFCHPSKHECWWRLSRRNGVRVNLARSVVLGRLLNDAEILKRSWQIYARSSEAFLTMHEWNLLNATSHMLFSPLWMLLLLEAGGGARIPGDNRLYMLRWR